MLFRSDLVPVLLDRHLAAYRHGTDPRPGAARVVTEARASTRPSLEMSPRLLPLCRTDGQLNAVIAARAAGAPLAEVELDWMELVGLGRAVERARRRGAVVGVATVRVQKPGEEKIDAHLARLAPDRVLVRSWGSLAYFRTLADAPTLHGDFSLNVTNSEIGRAHV